MFICRTDKRAETVNDIIQWRRNLVHPPRRSTEHRRCWRASLLVPEETFTGMFYHLYAADFCCRAVHEYLSVLAALNIQLLKKYFDYYYAIIRFYAEIPIIILEKSFSTLQTDGSILTKHS